MIDRLLFQKTDIRTLAAFRVLVGIWFFADYVGMMLNGYMKAAFIDAQMHFTFIGFDWVQPWPAWGMYVHYSVLGLAALGILLGYRYRLSLSIFLAGHMYVFLLDIVYTLNKYYLFALLAFLLLLMDAHRYWSLDARRKPEIKRMFTPRWTILIFQVMLLLIYFYSGISKLNVDWMFHQQPMSDFLGRREYITGLGDQFYQTIVYVFTYGGVIFDLSIVWLLLAKRTRLFAILLQGSFHLLNLTVLHIGTLSPFVGVATWFLFPTQWLKKRLDGRTWAEERVSVSPARRNWLIGFLAVFMVIQVLIPHRHYFTGNNVNWTEKGHRFSWRLMTRTKLGSRAFFRVVDPASNRQWMVNPREYLTGR
ncbi:MAG: HTTM domain-containing protein, partial [Bacteroidota bacterium]